MALITTLADSEALLFEERYYPQSGKIVLTRMWPNVDAKEAPDLCESMSDEITNPVASGNTFTGTYQGQMSRAAGEDDRSVTVYQTMTAAGSDTFTMTYHSDCGHKVTETRYYDKTDAEVAALVTSTIYPATALVTRTIQVERNQDLSYNLTIIIRDATGLEKDGLTDAGALTVGENKLISAVREYGYNLPVATLQTLAASYATPTENVTHDFRITRKDDCSFDFEGTIRTFSAGDTTFATTGAEGVAVSTKHGVHTPEASLPVVASAKRKRVRLSVKTDDKDVAEYDVQTETVQETKDSDTVVDSTLFFGRNVTTLPDFSMDNAGAETEGTDTHRIRSANISGNDDATLNYSVTVEPLHAFAHNITPTTITKGRRYVQTGNNQDSASVPTAPTGDQLLSAQVTEGDNGKRDFFVLSQDISSTTDTITHRGGKMYVGNNAALLPTAIKTTTNQVRGIARATAEGKWSYQLWEDTPTELTLTATTSGSKGHTVSLTARR